MLASTIPSVSRLDRRSKVKNEEMKKIFAIIAFSICCGTVAAQPKYTLEQIIDSARHNNIALRSAQHNIEAAQQQRKCCKRTRNHCFGRSEKILAEQRKKIKSVKTDANIFHPHRQHSLFFNHTDYGLQMEVTVNGNRTAFVTGNDHRV